MCSSDLFAFTCAYSEAMRRLPAISAAPAISPPAAAPNQSAAAPAAQARPSARVEHEQMAAARQEARLAQRRERHGIPLFAWLLPLLLLPLVALLMRRPEEALTPAPDSDRTVEASISAPLAMRSERQLVVLRNGGTVIPVYAAPNDIATANGSLADGQSVTLSGRRHDAWAELERGGWIEARHISAELARV